MSDMINVRVICDGPQELAFIVEYAENRIEVSARGEDYPNPQMAGKTFIYYAKGFVPPANLSEAARILHQLAEFISDIDTLGARSWLELYRAAARARR